MSRLTHQWRQSQSGDEAFLAHMNQLMMMNDVRRQRPDHLDRRDYIDYSLALQMHHTFGPPTPYHISTLVSFRVYRVGSKVLVYAEGGHNNYGQFMISPEAFLTGFMKISTLYASVEYEYKGGLHELTSYSTRDEGGVGEWERWVNLTVGRVNEKLQEYPTTEAVVAAVAHAQNVKLSQGEELVDPITYEAIAPADAAYLASDVRCTTNRAYDIKTLERILQKNAKNPFTRQPFTATNIKRLPWRS